MKSTCRVYKSKTRSHCSDENDEFEDETTNSESHFSYDSFRIVSRCSGKILEKGDDIGILYDKPKEIEYAISGAVSIIK